LDLIKAFQESFQFEENHQGFSNLQKGIKTIVSRLNLSSVAAILLEKYGKKYINMWSWLPKSEQGKVTIKQIQLTSLNPCR